MRGTNDSDSRVEVRPERQRGLANQIAMARARRNDTTLSRDEFMEGAVPELPEAIEPSHQDLRAELRRIIAEDAENAANDQAEPAPDVFEQTVVPVRTHSRVKVISYWLGCFFGIGAVTYALTTSN